ncbi:MAG TPA: glycoside hydrolase family 2 TIM barrel-domain containing protein [Steroidobacteraceae bacterium]|nr:glycoside hydrolase family 2 TIM barrel-domain containing protein [Steroidobacteraceae bacterium]
MHSRRLFLTQAGAIAAGSLDTSALIAGGAAGDFPASASVKLCGEWSFRTDPEDQGVPRHWHEAEETTGDWRVLSVPHTWQVDAALADYRGIAWYRRRFDALPEWGASAVRIEFEAVFHSATVWVNGQLAGEHLRKGYTAFTLDIGRLLRPGRSNSIAVRVDNSFRDGMLPRKQSSDWAHDGGIYRPVQLLITPKTFVERVDIEALPDLASGDGRLSISAQLRNTDSKAWRGHASFRIVDGASGLTLLSSADHASFTIEGGVDQTQRFSATLHEARWWHFDHPHLYQLVFSLANGAGSHQVSTRFGIRSFEAKGTALYLNGERVRLMGVERMAGSNPTFGMAEPAAWITHDHDEMKRLNCLFTRVHWPQDRRVLDYCDQHGILMQSEIPAWGYDSFAGMNAEPDADILENGLAQLREMIARDRNHPSVVAWGLANEIGGQNPPAYQFVKHMLAEAKRLDPSRLCAYASNSLADTPERDVAGLMDVIEANEYYGTWAPGTPETVARHLDSLHAAFPDKPVIISEYGYCACTDDRPEGDEHRIEGLRSHDAVFRSKEFVAGAIFFCLNDYRTHVGHSGVGALKQNVHGVVDLFGVHKPSFEVLNRELSPVASLDVDNLLNSFHVRVRARGDLPSHTLRDYRLRGVFYAAGDTPLEERVVSLAEIAPGSEISVELGFSQPGVPVYVVFDVFRPTGFSAYSLKWKP